MTQMEAQKLPVGNQSDDSLILTDSGVLTDTDSTMDTSAPSSATSSSSTSSNTSDDHNEDLQEVRCLFRIQESTFLQSSDDSFLFGLALVPVIGIIAGIAICLICIVAVALVIRKHYKKGPSMEDYYY